MDIQKLAKDSRTEEIERHLLTLDDQFSFECQKCGKCCKHQHSILFNTRDIFYIARKLRMTTREVIEKYAETYIGTVSKIPVIHMDPLGKNAVCPFLKDDRCSIHECKPTVCALYPLGRVVVDKAASEGGVDDSDSELEVKYVLNNTNCGSKTQVHTVRGWLARFSIPEHDEFFMLWSRLMIRLREMISKLEEKHASDVALNFFWNAIYMALYVHYDTSQDFLPQFRQTSETLAALCQETIKAVERMDSSKLGK